MSAITIERMQATPTYQISDKLQSAIDLAAKEVKLLRLPDSKLHKTITNKILSLRNGQQLIENLNQLRTTDQSNAGSSSNLKPASEESSNVTVTQPLPSKLIQKPHIMPDSAHTELKSVPKTYAPSIKSIIRAQVLDNTKKRTIIPKPITKPLNSNAAIKSKVNHVEIPKKQAEKKEFYVPIVESGTHQNETRTGLVYKKKNFQTELERMREESDLRLQKAILKKEQRQKLKVLNENKPKKSSKVSSKQFYNILDAAPVRKLNALATPGKKDTKQEYSNTLPVQRDNSKLKSQPKSKGSDEQKSVSFNRFIEERLQTYLSKSQKQDPNYEVVAKSNRSVSPNRASIRPAVAWSSPEREKSPKIVKKTNEQEILKSSSTVHKVRSQSPISESKLFKQQQKPAKSITPKSPKLKAKNTSTLSPQMSKNESIPKHNAKSLKSDLNEEGSRNPELISKIIELLGAKLDPVFHSVQQHMERTVNLIDAKLSSHQSIPTTIEIENSKSIEEDSKSGIDLHDNLQQHYVSLNAPEVPLIELCNTPAHSSLTVSPNASPILAMNEPSAVNIGTNRENASEIFIHNSPPFKHSHIQSSKPANNNSLILPLDCIQRILDDRSRRKKWTDAFFGYSDTVQPWESVEKYLLHHLLIILLVYLKTS
ncbi:hypothetical protein BC833DRAFT_603225 [Globomyces pollinis-pini]|nr:hypothetical protein BC833DRAFT_603225 [Globomyces pollinis-pini]